MNANNCGSVRQEVYTSNNKIAGSEVDPKSASVNNNISKRSEWLGVFRVGSKMRSLNRLPLTSEKLTMKKQFAQ